MQWPHRQHSQLPAKTFLVLMIGFALTSEAQTWQSGGTLGSHSAGPIVMSLKDADEYRFTSAADGVLFDIDGNGQREQIGWTEGDALAAFLAIDRNEDGLINDGKELFGNHTHPDARNGFHALMLMNLETNGGIKHGSVSSDDPLYERLLLWRDRNHNGVSERSELRRVADFFSDVRLSWLPTSHQDQHGNRFAYRGWAQRRTGPGRNMVKDPDENIRRTVHIWNVYFQGIRQFGETQVGHSMRVNRSTTACEF